MLHLNIYGEDRPVTLWELIAAQNIQPSIKAALHYLLGVIATRYPRLHAWLNYYDELYACLSLGLESLSFIVSDASFGEWMYGLKRTPRSPSSRAKSHNSLSATSKALGVFFQAGFPYLRSKLDSFQLHASISAARETSVSGLMKLQIVRFVYRSFASKWVPWPSIGYHCMGAGVDRVSSSHPTSGGKPLLAYGDSVLQTIRVGLLVSAFVFRGLEMWAGHVEDKKNRLKHLPIPHPPPKVSPSPVGLALPKTPGQCPLCLKKFNNPTVVTMSGYVYCYQCIHPYVTKTSRCPVSQMKVSLDHLRRVFIQ